MERRERRGKPEASVQIVRKQVSGFSSRRRQKRGTLSPLATRFPVLLWALVFIAGPGCVGVDELFVALDPPGSGQTLLIEGEGEQARLIALESVGGVVRSSEGVRIRALLYADVALPPPLPAIATEGSPLPTPTSLLELVAVGHGYAWRESAFATLELRLREPDFCSTSESEALIPLPVPVDGDLHLSSLALRDGRLLVAGFEHLFVIDGLSAERSPWTSNAGPKGGPRTLSEGPDGLWFQAAGEIYFAPTTAGAAIEPTRQSILPSGAADSVYTTPEEARLLIVDQIGTVFEYSPARGLSALLTWRVDARVAMLNADEMVLVVRGDESPPRFAEFARYRDGVLHEDMPFGDEATRSVTHFAHRGAYVVGAEGGRVAFDRGQGWQRVDVFAGSLLKVKALAPTPRGFLIGTSTGELIEHVWGRGNCPTTSFEGANLAAIQPLGNDRYAVVPSGLTNGVRVLRLTPP